MVTLRLVASAIVATRYAICKPDKRQTVAREKWSNSHIKSTQESVRAAGRQMTTVIVLEQLELGQTKMQ
jgi:predicted transcriptional regulator